MAKLKAYTLGINGFARSWMNDALGIPGHVRQVDTLIAAASKTDAADLARTLGFGMVRTSDSEFRMVSGSNEHPMTTAMLKYAAGAPAVFAHEFNPGDGAPVLGASAGGEWRVVGHLRRLSPDTLVKTFVPAELDEAGLLAVRAS